MNIKELYKNINTGDRWSEGIPHHPKSKELMKHVAELDFCFNGDYFGWKLGGDGDNGEIMMYLLDMYFDWKEKV